MAENGLITSTDLGNIKSIDFVNRYSYSIQGLLDVLGVTRRLPLSQDVKIKTYKWSVTKPAKQVEEGETIPLTKVEKKEDKEYTVPFNKYRKVTTAEAIRRYGHDLAVNETDDKMLQDIQEDIKRTFFTFLSTAPTKQQVEGFQKALSLGWAKTKTFFPGNPQIVSFVSAMDVAKYLGDAPISSGASTDYGFTLLTGFLNQKVFVFDDIPEGKVYSTAIENIVFANQQVSGNDLEKAFNLTVDQSNLIGVTHSVITSNATIETLAFQGSTLFAEISNGVVETTITEPTPEEPETPETKS